MRRRFDDKRSLNIAKRFIIKLWRKVETEWKEFSIGSGCILGGVRGRWTTSMEEKVEKSTVNSRDSFVIIHRSIVRMAQLSFLRLSRPFVRSNDQFLFHLHSVFLSPYLFLSLFFFLTVNFDKEPFFFIRKAPYFPFPLFHYRRNIWKKIFGDFVDLVALSRWHWIWRWTRKERILFGKSNIEYCYAKNEIFGFVFTYIFIKRKRKSRFDSIVKKKCQNESIHLFVNDKTHLQFHFRIQRYRFSLFWLHPRRLGLPSFCLRLEEFSPLSSPTGYCRIPRRKL